MIKLFAHRGYLHSKNNETIKENSTRSLDNAYDNLFKAVEFDIWFFENQLILNHDKPTENDFENLLKIDEYFYYKNQINYWLDFKNLNISNCQQVIDLLKISIQKNNISLDNIYFAPYNLCYKEISFINRKFIENFGEIKFLAILESKKNKNELNEFKEFLIKNKIKYLSVFHELIDENFVQNFRDFEFFAWTVNDLERLKILHKMEVKNFATDNLTPKIIHENTAALCRS